MTSPPTETVEPAAGNRAWRRHLRVGEGRPGSRSVHAAERGPDSLGPAPPAAPDTVRVLLAEEHPAVRAVMRELIDGQAGMRVVGEAVDARAALEWVRRLQVDVAVVDMALPGPGGAALIGQLRRLCPGLRVVATSTHQDRHFPATAIRAGASSFVLKDSAGSGLVGAIYAAACGRGCRRHP